MKWIRRNALAGELLAGTFLNLGSSLTAEIAGNAGFDWVLVDLEHGAGDRSELLAQLQALESTRASPIVRIGWNDRTTFKRVLDLGPSGIMVPYVSSAEEARYAAASLEYPPSGIRGVASSPRCCRFGADFDRYFRDANEELILVTQIETAAAVKNAEAIAAVERIDVLFVGPLDLSVSLGRPREFDHPDFRRALREVVVACRERQKPAGILAWSADALEGLIADGFTFVGCGSDGGVVSSGFRDIAKAFEACR